MKLRLAILVACLIFTGTVEAHSAIYPPKQPLWGQTTDGRPAVLWYEDGRLYNSNPADELYARSHWDAIAWQGKWLVYTGTYAVTPLAPTWITFKPGIRYMPLSGKGSWIGVSRFHSESGSGDVLYMNSMRGGHLSIHEWMFWDAGSRYVGVTDWREDYQFAGGQLVRAWGGNVTGADSWDITFG